MAVKPYYMAGEWWDGAGSIDVTSPFDRSVVPGVVLNDASALRADQMPYGGSKDSGFVREDLRSDDRAQDPDPVERPAVADLWAGPAG
jgi:hypothetical protein